MIYICTSNMLAMTGTVTKMWWMWLRLGGGGGGVGGGGAPSVTYM